MKLLSKAVGVVLVLVLALAHDALQGSSMILPLICEPSVHRSCNTVDGKEPGSSFDPEGASFEPPDEDARRHFERTLARSLARTFVVEAVTETFIARVATFIVEAARVESGWTADEALLRAFGGGSPTNTGYVGRNVTAIRQVIAHGNLRERWALIYVLQKTGYFDSLLMSLVGKAVRSRNTSQLGLLGLHTDAVITRFREIAVTHRRLPRDRWQSDGMADFLWPPFSSWVRFDFDGPPDGRGSPLWQGARRQKPGGCTTGRLRSDDHIFPPLSARERAYQCPNGEPCVLQWHPGSACFDLVDTPLGAGPGLVARAEEWGLRLVAGASGTTANTLQMAVLLGLAPEELVLVRLAMISWLVLSDDHSLFEVLVAAEPFMEEPWKLAREGDDNVLCLLAAVMPHAIQWNGTTVAPADIWRPAVLDMSAEQKLWAQVPAATRSLLACLAQRRRQTSADGKCCRPGPKQTPGPATVGPAA